MDFKIIASFTFNIFYINEERNFKENIFLNNQRKMESSKSVVASSISVRGIKCCDHAD